MNKLPVALLFSVSLTTASHADFSTVGFANFIASTDLVHADSFTLDQINDGITGTQSSFNGFVTNTLGSISFTFNQDYDLRSFLLWNDVVVVDEGIDDFSLSFFDSSDAQIVTPFATNYVGPQTQVAGEEYIFDAPVLNVRRVVLDVTSVQSGTFTTRIEIREVDFGVIPEPASALYLGFAGIAFVTTRRRNRRA
ncbi:MAG: PEP-CTERM sorting domain-containing protein [Opitutaceae bacterium]